jgi:hypothetical protein
MNGRNPASEMYPSIRIADRCPVARVGVLEKWYIVEAHLQLRLPGNVISPVRVTWRARLLFEFGILWCVSRAGKLHAIAIRISYRHNPQTVSDRWTFPYLDSAQLEFAIKRHRVVALKTYVDSDPQRFFRLIFRRELPQIIAASPNSSQHHRILPSGL